MRFTTALIVMAFAIVFVAGGSSAAAADAPKIAVVNLLTVLETSVPGKAAQNELKTQKDKLEADLAKALMSIGAVKGFEVGNGFAAARLRGSENNDPMYRDEVSGRVRTRSNNAAGIAGGISNGEEIVLKIAVKPASSIRKEQETVSVDGEAARISVEGRHMMKKNEQVRRLRNISHRSEHGKASRESPLMHQSLHLQPTLQQKSSPA